MNLALYPTIITPFTSDNKIDYTSLAKFIDYLFYYQSDGLFAVCQSSEMFFLSEDEKLELASFCVEQCRRQNKKCVVSGHTQDRLEDQLSYLKKLEKLRPDAIILVSNRLAAEQASDEVLIQNLDYLIAGLKPETRLGLYECPYPYKRLLSEPVIEHMVQTGRFDFIKDTSCDALVIRRRLVLTSSSSIQLYNANAATLMQSLSDGAAGYSGVMLNFIPEVFGRLKQYLAPAAAVSSKINQTAKAAGIPLHDSHQEKQSDIERQPQNSVSDDGLPPQRFDIRTAQNIAAFIATASVFEARHYPVSAKVHLMAKGLLETTVTRSAKPDNLPASQTSELRDLANQAQKLLCRYEPLVPKQMLFSQMPPFQSCHASTVLPIGHDQILAAYFAGEREGADDVGIWLSRRTHGIWQAPECIAKTADLPHWNPVLFMNGQTIHLYFKVGSTVSEWQSWHMCSLDKGVSWSAPAALPDDNPAGGPVRSKPVYLSNGWLLAPNSEETSDAWQPHVDRSVDGGYTFQKLADVPLNKTAPEKPGYITGKGAIQPTLWESSPGNVHMLLRTTEGVIFRSDSRDYGQTWCLAYPTHLPNNNSGIDLVSDGRRLFLALNPISQNWGSRNPLVILHSTDNGQSFKHYRTLENMEVDPEHLTDAEFSYPAIVINAHKLHLTYTCLRRQIAYCCLNLE